MKKKFFMPGVIDYELEFKYASLKNDLIGLGVSVLDKPVLCIKRRYKFINFDYQVGDEMITTRDIVAAIFESPDHFYIFTPISYQQAYMPYKIDKKDVVKVEYFD